MATSGTKTWTLYVDEVIDEAVSRIGSDPITGKEASSARRTLNIMMRDWGNRGVQLWTIDETTQTVTEGTANYTLDTYIVDITEAVLSRTENSVRTDFQMEKINREDYMNIPVKSTKEDHLSFGWTCKGMPQWYTYIQRHKTPRMSFVIKEETE